MQFKLIIAILFSILSFSAYAEDAKTEQTPFSLATTGFLDQGALPVMYTCDGKDISPEISWSNIPAKTQSLALLMTDLNAPSGTFYHWVIYNIPKSAASLPHGMEKVPSGAQLGKNSWDKASYNGPCPPKGGAHTYEFTVFALDTKLTVPKDANGEAIKKAMDTHILASAKLSTTYSRWLK